MADYKKLADSLLNRAKELAESETVTGVVDKVRGSAAGAGLTGVLEKGAQRAKSFGAATKNTLDLSRDHKELERVFSEIGKLYYEQAAGLPEGLFAPLFEQVALLQQSISAKEAEMEAYKASFGQGSTSSQQTRSEQELHGRIDDFESIVNQTENDGQR